MLEMRGEDDGASSKLSFSPWHVHQEAAELFAGDPQRQESLTPLKGVAASTISPDIVLLKVFAFLPNDDRAKFFGQTD